MDKPLNKKYGAFARTQEARTKIKEIFSNTRNRYYFLKDAELSKVLDISRHTVKKIRGEQNIPTRALRILEILANIDTEKFTITELSLMLNLRYQNLYKVIKMNHLPFKPDTPPIESLRRYHERQKSIKVSE